ncbi:type VI secretion system tip protein VgrG, partial [Citrobacter freundii complex sp. 2024EL-00219]
LEVKGDLAQKISGALGLKVQDDIVLESSSRISLKVGGSFVVIHPGGVDIMGLKINLNGGGSAGTPVGVMQPGALEALADNDADDVDDNRTGNDDNSDDNEDNQDNTDKYYLQFHFTDDDGIPYANTEYIAYFSSGMQKKGLTNKEGNTERFISNAMDSVEVKLTLYFQNN